MNTPFTPEPTLGPHGAAGYFEWRPTGGGPHSLRQDSVRVNWSAGLATELVFRPETIVDGIRPLRVRRYDLGRLAAGPVNDGRDGVAIAHDLVDWEFAKDCVEAAEKIFAALTRGEAV